MEYSVSFDKMKKMILTLLLSASAIFAFEKNKDGSFTYGTVGVDSFIPTLSIGSREWKEDSGFDINLSLSSMIVLNRVAVNASYLKRLSNNQYIGIGGGAFFALLDTDYMFFTNGGIFPSLKFGKEFESHFHEVSVVFPQITADGICLIPLISYKYGF